MKKPSDRIKEIADKLFKMLKNDLPFSQAEITNMNVSGIIEFLDEWFGKVEFRRVGSLQCLTEKQEPVGPPKPVGPPDRLVKLTGEERRDPTPQEPNDFEIQYRQGWNDLYYKTIQIKGKYFNESQDSTGLTYEEFRDKIKSMWDEFKELKK